MQNSGESDGKGAFITVFVLCLCCFVLFLVLKLMDLIVMVLPGAMYVVFLKNQKYLFLKIPKVISIYQK